MLSVLNEQERRGERAATTGVCSSEQYGIRYAN